MFWWHLPIFGFVCRYIYKRYLLGAGSQPLGRGCQVDPGDRCQVGMEVGFAIYLWVEHPRFLTVPAYRAGVSLNSCWHQIPFPRVTPNFVIDKKSISYSVFYFVLSGPASSPKTLRKFIDPKRVNIMDKWGSKTKTRFLFEVLQPPTKISWECW